MQHMHMDKTGAAVVVGIMDYIMRSGRPRACDVVAVVPLVENMPDGNAIRPRDILRSYNGKTIEIDNTDAEGRLIFADVLAYAAKRFRPRVIVNFATLTGWSSQLFCDSSFAYFCASDELSSTNDIEAIEDKTQRNRTIEAIIRMRQACTHPLVFVKGIHNKLSKTESAGGNVGYASLFSRQSSRDEAANQAGMLKQATMLKQPIIVILRSLYV